MLFTDEEKLQILRDVLAIESENDQEAEVAEYFSRLLAKYGIESEIIEYQTGRSSLIANIYGSEGREGKVLVYSGHFDVVSAGDHNDWTYPPFAGEIHDGKIYGRGTSDMKSGLVDLVLAAIELKEAGANFKGCLRLALTVGEEIGMYGSKQLVESGYLDDADGFLIAEPSGSESVVYAHKGSIQYEIIAHGKTVHSSMPEVGIDALQLMVDYINLSNQRFDESFNTKSAYNTDLGKTLNVNTVIEGGTQINSVAGLVKMKANTRTVPEADNELVLSIINDSIEELNAKTEGYLELNLLQNNPPATSTEDNDLIKAIQSSVNHGLELTVTGGATDASNFGQIGKDYDLAVYGPGEPSVAHQENEYVELDKFLSFVDIYKETALNYLK
ncbi:MULTISPECIES: ArgE/DapE family deacylase [Aerococcus]|uniref:Probable succinyl-diaminopimelate desuccinylase n=1 Tax=Aerococcus urinae TaxID=1376 RepID=A0A7T2VSM8_9LACT|nr:MULTISPECIES: ArgE/DapE family deacylase [Aerococcus]MCY3032388.1 ArgE/DapE family deacylase [Aerococcus urinae]MCY3037401.1 ArgE/DapE family deacylase [Aerococcus urinae]MCY3044434.1 ArgE/DapE family deacylase [Aerococcus urinae]MCY3047889.1 ArgE/DapE family deacylase [Aerococcus urinae]MCY3050112.1 ArgE/DapE family deacylase [Aerococcus urinae]